MAIYTDKKVFILKLKFLHVVKKILKLQSKRAQIDLLLTPNYLAKDALLSTN